MSTMTHRHGRTTASGQADWITVGELASIWRVDRKTVYEAIKAGQVPGVKRIGRCIRILRSAISHTQR